MRCRRRLEHGLALAVGIDDSKELFIAASAVSIRLETMIEAAGCGREGVVVGAAGTRMAGTGAAWRATKRCQIEQFAHAVVPLTYEELVKVTGGELADVA